MKKSNKVTFLTQAAVIAAIYVVLTIIFAPFSFGEVQVRISEAPVSYTHLPEVLCISAGSPARLVPFYSVPRLRYAGPEYGMWTPADQLPDKFPALRWNGKVQS